MSNVARIALPGYNAQTDTNLDHFSLYADIDNVLIKRALTGQVSVADGSPTIQTIPHNLGYIPFFIAYYYDEVNLVWSVLDNQYNPFSVPQQICAADTTNFYIYNFGGHSSGQVTVAYDIFYDNMSNTTAPSIVESDKVFKVARPNKNALTSKNPNDYIMHSDLNNFKILYQGNATITIPNGGLFSPTTFAHGANVQSPFKYFLFIKFPDGYTTITGDAGVYSYNTSYGTIKTAMDGTYFYFYNFGSSVTVSISWVIYGTGKSGTINNQGKVISVASSGHNVLTETNPDNFNFHSNYNTLKYFQSGTYSMTVSNTTTQTIAHNLGYVPFHIGFVNDLAGIISNSYAIAPYYWGRSGITPNNDIAAFVYADSINIYLKTYFQANAVGTSVTFNFYYKIFKNNLGL